jgi:hypothetical protein
MVNGIHGAKAIVPIEFGRRPVCTWGAQPNLALATNYQDLWWTAGGAESGWGINFTHQGNIVFATWFTYGASGKPWWVTVELHNTADGVYTGNAATFAYTVNGVSEVKQITRIVFIAPGTACQ